MTDRQTYEDSWQTEKSWTDGETKSYRRKREREKKKEKATGGKLNYQKRVTEWSSV